MEQIHFITGRLAESALRETLDSLAPQAGFEYTIQVLPITVAALLTPKWIAARIEIPEGTDRILLPGYAAGDLEPLRGKTGLPVELGPKDLRRLPDFFGRKSEVAVLDSWNIEIIAEINHAPRIELKDFVDIAKSLVKDGADIVDVGCEPSHEWARVGEYVGALVDEGIRVSIDSLNPNEIGKAVEAGAELVLSVNSSNRDAAVDWGVEVVVIPDEIQNLESITPTIEFLERHGVVCRIDPILEPIGFGFAASLQRYMEARSRWPHLQMMMGIGNLTELSDVDSAGVNFLLLAICEELQIHSVLTTQVINWARTSVREIDVARRIVHHSIANRVPPKRVSEALVCLRDARLVEFGVNNIERLASLVTDPNYRIFAEGNDLHLMGGGAHVHAADPFEVFDQLMATQPKNVDPSHAFYLGYELCKARLATQLGKQYTQDEALNWGYLTESEKDRHRISRRRGNANDNEKRDVGFGESDTGASDSGASDSGASGADD